MKKILLAVDGSPSAQHATQALIDHLTLYKVTPQIHVVSVHLPIPNVGTAGSMIDPDIVDRYYKEGLDEALAPSLELLKNAGVSVQEHRLVGDIAQKIVATAQEQGCDSIIMGSRGHTALTNVVLGSIATKVLHLAKVPVTLVR